MSGIFLAPEEFAEDLEHSLGRANGNIYHRKPGVPGQHDGQIMIRLKKKRFVILDYSTGPPTDQDLAAAEQSPNRYIPEGAGTQACSSPNCNKIGVPVMVYDSEPSETSSLYLRSGLCFSCQRDLNEKRRTERKRPAEGSGAKDGGEGTTPTKRKSRASSAAGSQQQQPGMQFYTTLGPGTNKKFKMDGRPIQLNRDAIIINGPLEGTRRHGNGYSFQEIGHELKALTREVLQNTDRLVDTVVSGGSNNNNHDPSTTADVAAAGTEFTSTEAQAAAAAAAAAATADAVVGGLLDSSATAALPTATSTAPGDNNNHAMSPLNTHEDIAVLYDRAFLSMNKSIYLLTQWKASWDAAVSAAHESVAADSASLMADAVASAAAVAAATTTSSSAAAAGLPASGPASSITDGHDHHTMNAGGMLLGDGNASNGKGDVQQEAEV